MIAALLAAAALSAACDLEHPSGAPDCTRQLVDALPMNAIQVIGTHNSYKQAIAPNEWQVIHARNAKGADTLDYSHLPLAQQLDAGARQLEIDYVYDPKPGLYAEPLGYKLAGDKVVPYDFAPMRKPGLKVIHVPDLDYRSVCRLFTDCLTDIRTWSKAHPDHVPILVIMNLKEDGAPVPGGVKPPLFDAAGMNEIDREIRSVFPESALITPDKVQGKHPTLRDAVAAGAWPRLKAARGKVMFALDAPPDQVARYRESRKVLEGRVCFVNTDETSPAAAYITLNEPQELSARIRSAVKAGLIVRTRADADTWEARKNDTTRQLAAFASGAQYVSTDYMDPDPRFGPYRAQLPGGGVARRDPVEPSPLVAKR
jgi:hypothetical protein